jgi:hypothetical protein
VFKSYPVETVIIVPAPRREQIATLIGSLSRTVGILTADIEHEEAGVAARDLLDPTYPVLARSLRTRTDNIRATIASLEALLGEHQACGRQFSLCADVLAVLMQVSDVARPDLGLVTGLASFGLPFAVNSSLHSYLILAYAGSEKAAEDVVRRHPWREDRHRDALPCCERSRPPARHHSLGLALSACRH